MGAHGKIELTGEFVCPECGTHNPYAMTLSPGVFDEHRIECLPHLGGCDTLYTFKITATGHVFREAVNTEEVTQ